MKELGIKQFKSSIYILYHPQLQGASERHYQTLKSMIRAYCDEQEGKWVRSVPLLLSVIRESICESTRFSPFELAFGHEERGLEVHKGEIPGP